MHDAATDLESLDDFRRRARAFIEDNLDRADPEASSQISEDDARVLQAVIFDAGFAGIAMPRMYGGAGLTLEHQKVWAEEVEGRVVPEPLYVSIGMLGITLLDHGSETLKQRHLPRILRGEEIWLQLLSEPSGGSDMAGAMTRATRDGDTWVINGAKMWSTGAGSADYGMCLARTDWDVPKHSGLSMFAVPLRAPGVTVEPIFNTRGEDDFFQEFFDDVVIPADHLIGEENEGWAVAHSLLFHERNATAGVGHGLGLGGGHGAGAGAAGGTGIEDIVRYATVAGTIDDPAIRQLIAEAFIDHRAREHTNDRVETGMRLGAFEGDWGSLLKLGLALDTVRRGEISLAAAASDGVIWDDDTPGGGEAAHEWLEARDISIAGGTNEMQRNIVSERLLGMPREPAADRDIAFREVVARRKA